MTLNSTTNILTALSRLTVIVAMLVTTGCLVDENDVPTLKNRSTDVLRTFVGGEFYDYAVFGQVTPTDGTPTSFEGSLHVEYTATTIPDPLVVSNNLSVIREDSTLTLGAAVFNLTRFIQQDGTGTYYVVAARSPIGTMYYTGETIASNPHRIAVLPSPVPSLGSLSNFDYDFMQGCVAPSGCSTVVQTINDTSIVYQGDADITTNKGRFLALRIDYTNGSFLNSGSPTLFDLRGACDEDLATFFGSTYIFPEVGIVFIDNSCSIPGGGGHRYTASLVNTNVPIP